MDVRKIIRQEILKEFRIPFSSDFISAPKTFDHLKWELNHNQKHYLGDLCSVHPDSLTEADFKNASQFLGIPEKSVRSIVNTYNTYNPLSEMTGDSEAARNSQLTFGNKAANAHDIGLSVDDSRLPDRDYPMGRHMHTNDRGMTRNQLKHKLEAPMKDRVLYRSGSDQEHPSKKIERMYESLTQSLMLYLYCESKPKDINLRADDKIQIDFEPIISEGEFNQLNGGPNYETEKFKETKKLLEAFNEKFGCSFVVYDHVNLEDCQRLYIEHNITKQIDMSQDSMKMMKKFLLPRVMMGYKALTNDPSVMTLMGLDAGDTTWLYGKIGEPMQSGVLSRHHAGRA